jgi:hypothetical protein
MGTQCKSKCHSLPSDAPQNKGPPPAASFLFAHWFLEKRKVLNPTQVAVHFRKQLERKTVIEISILVTHDPAGVQTRSL